jgi:hypothetical protein
MGALIVYNMKRILTVAFLLGLMDCITTIWAIKSGYGYEANPSAGWIHNKLGLIPANILSIPYFMSVIGIGYYLHTKFKSRIISNTLYYTTFFILALKLFVVVGNIIVITNGLN